MSEARDAVDLSRLSFSFSLPLYKPLPTAALLKLLVEGNCLIFVCEGGKLAPWILTILPLAENTEPSGVVARCMSSGGGGDDGLGGGPSPKVLRSGTKLGGGIILLVGGGGNLGGGGSVTIGGFDLSEELSKMLVVVEDGTRERTTSSAPIVPTPVPEEMIESIDCLLSEAVMRLPTEPVVEVIDGSRKIEARGDVARTVAGGVNTVVGGSPLRLVG